MADYQRVIEFLRDLRQAGPGPGGLQTVTPEIQQMAADYAALCVQANDRLRQCSAFLQQGLRSEAIHLADQSPNLLDLVAQLDLPDGAAWAEFCQNNGIAVPPPLALDRAAQLNEAYAQDQPLEHLLSRHRMLALSRSPVRERLHVMRKIAQMDPASPYWEKDIRVFEAARLRELPTAFYSAVKNRDEDALGDLNDEVNRQQWYEPVPADLSAALSDAYSRIQRSGVEAELRKLVEPLRDAFAAQSLQECQALVARWKNIMASAGVVTIAADLLDEIRPVVSFIGEQTKRDEQVRRFQEACKGFTKLLDADAADAQLEAGYARLKEYHEDIPEDLTRRYMNKKTGRRREVERRHKFNLITVGAGAAAVVIISLVVIWLLVTGSRVQATANSIRADVNRHTRESLKHAQDQVDILRQNNPSVLREQQVADAVSALQVARNQYDTDAQSVKALASRLDQARQKAAALAARPDAPPDEMRAAASALQVAVNETNASAEKLAWADGDGKLAASLVGARATLSSMQERLLAGVRSELADLSSVLETIPASPSTPAGVAEAKTKLASLNSRLETLRSTPLLDDDANSRISAFSDALAKRLSGADSSGSVTAELQTIRTNTNSAADWRAALDSFVKRFPSDPRTADFKSALDRANAADAMDGWQQLVANFSDHMAAGPLQATQKRLDAVNGFLAAHPDLPKAAQAGRYADYLKKAADALADKGTWQTAFADLAGSPMMTDLAYMGISDGRKIYTLGDIKRIDRRINSQVSVTFDALDLKDITKRITITIDPPLTVTDDPVPAPHTMVMTEISDSLKLINENDWDTYGIDLADKLVRNDQMDPVVKAILLLQTLKTEEAVSGWALGDLYDRVINDLSRQSPEQLPWYDASKISDGTKKAIKQAVAAVPPVAQAKEKLAAEKDLLFKAAGESMTTGVLLKDDAGAWNVFTQARPVNGSMIWIIVAGPPAPPRPAETPATSPAASAPASGPAALFGDAAATAAPPANASPTMLKMVGTAGAGKFLLDDAELKSVPEGTIVYVSRP